jgi:hypothetical protein
MQREETDVIIIGAGPAGLQAGTPGGILSHLPADLYKGLSFQDPAKHMPAGKP